jgi:hypothetical protein
MVATFKPCINSMDKFVCKAPPKHPVLADETQENPKFFFCGLCKQSVEAETASEHSNYHVALRLQQYEQKLADKQTRRPSASKSRSAKRRKGPNVLKNQRRLDSFFQKSTPS